MKRTKKLFSRLLIGVFCLTLFLPLNFNVALSADNLDAWKDIDFDQEILLLDDYDVYQDQVEQLISEGRENEIADLQPQMRKMSNPIVLDRLNAPLAVQKEALGITKSIEDENSVNAKSDLELFREKYENPKNILDLKKEKPLKIEKSEALENPTGIKPEVKILKKIEGRNHKLFNVTLEGLDLRSSDGRKQAFAKFLNMLPTAYASYANPLMEYYAGMEDHLMDSALYYIGSIQNPDGSFGTYNRYELTGEIALLLASFRKTSNDQFDAALQYLINTEPQNNREKAIKARLMFGLGEPYQIYLDELIATQNPDGGIGLYDNYQSDVLTTLEMSLALYVAGYSLADAMPESLYYVVQRIDSSGAMYYTENSDPSYYLVNKTARYFHTFRNLSVGGSSGTAIPIQDKIDDLINFLNASYDSSTEELYGSNDLIDYAMTLYTFQLHGVGLELQELLREIFEMRQSVHGDFGTSLYSTVESMRAMAQSDLVITDISSTGSLQNKTTASFAVTIENHGYKSSNHAYIHTFVDNFDIEVPIDLLANNVSISPGGTVVLNITYPNTNSFIGDTEMKFYIEEENESDYTNNWLAATFNFVSMNNAPALPMYFVAHAHQMDGQPALNIRWQRKDDVNRLNYVAMWREKGTSQWNYAGIYNDWNGAFLSGVFDEGKTYEITAGVLHHDQQTVTYFTNYDEVRMTVDETLYLGDVNGQLTKNHNGLVDELLFGYGVLERTDVNGNFTFEDVANGTTAVWLDADPYEGIIKKFEINPGQTTEDVRVFTRLKNDTEDPVISNFEIRFSSNYIVMNQHEVDLLVVASDNVALKDADFYHWDPVQSYWAYIGNQSFENQNNLIFSWYVAGSLLGTGHKVKAVARDYQGNESAEVEWGPFEIIDGSTPTFELLSPNGGETWELGATETIEWIAQSANGMAEVDIGLVYPNKSYFEHNANNTGSYDYEINDSYNYVSDQVKIRVDGEDDVTGVYSEDYSDNYFSIVDTSPVPDAPWEDPYLISKDFNYGFVDGKSYSPMIKYDQNGVSYVIYRYVHDDIWADDRTITERLYYLTVDVNGIASIPEQIYERVHITNSGLNGYMPLRNIEMVLDSNGYPHLVLEKKIDDFSNYCDDYNVKEIFYIYYDGLTWSSLENISDNSTYSSFSTIAIDDFDNLHVVWNDGQSYDSACVRTGIKAIYYITKLAGSTFWTVPEVLAENEGPSDLAVAVTDNGIVHLVYKAGDPQEMLHMMKTGNVWSVATTIGFYAFHYPQLAQGLNNSLHLVVKGYSANPYYYAIVYKYYDGNTWVEEVALTPEVEGEDAFNPQVIVDGNNVPYVTYEKSFYHVNARALHWTTKADGNWIPAQIVHRSSQYIGNDSSRIAYAGNNKMSAVWGIYSEGYPHIMINHADLTNMPSTPTIQILEPTGGDDVADENYTISWIDDDQDHNAMINFYYDTDNTGQDGLAVNLATIFEDDLADTYVWDTSDVAEGNYYIYAVMNNEDDDPIVAYSSGVVTVKHHVMYEDAENQNIAGWEIVDDVPAGAQILNVVDSEHGGRVIEFDGAPNLGNSYKLLLEDGNEWNNTEYLFIQWDQKFSENYEIYIGVETTIGDRFMKYTPTDDSLGVNGTVIHNGLGHKADDGTWITFARDLQTHFHKIYPGANILAVNSFKVVGNGRVDNIKLLREMPDGYSNDNLFEMMQPNFVIPDLWPLGIDEDKLPKPDMLNF
jgi:D-glucuronyl C5-epimerase, beta-sandwich domain